MSKVKKLTNYFKMVTKDEREVEELLATQLSRNSRTATIESAKTLSTLSSAVMSIVDLTDYSSDLLSPALNAIAEYESAAIMSVMMNMKARRLNLSEL